MNESKLVLEIAVDVVDPTTCSIGICTVPMIRGPTEWTEAARRTADRMARAVLGHHELEVLERETLNNARLYRVITRAPDGWKVVT